MDAFLDALWLKILAALEFAADTADTILAPLDGLGPAWAILILVFATVSLSRFLGRVYNTQRHQELEKEYHHWLNLRQEAMGCQDREKGKAMAKNIDQAKLNKAYYDYFFEGFLKNILTTILPILLVAAYVNRAYAPAKLLARFGRSHIFKFPNTNGEPVTVGPFFWFVISLLLVYTGWAASKFAYRRWIQKPKDMPATRKN